MILPLFQLRLCRRMGCAAREPRAGSVLRPCGGGRSPLGDERDDADDGQNREGRCSIGGERRGIECWLGSGLGSPGPPCGSMSPSPNQKSPPLFLCRVFLPVSRLNLSARRRARRDGHHRLRRAHLFVCGGTVVDGIGAPPFVADVAVAHKALRRWGPAGRPATRPSPLV